MAAAHARSTKLESVQILRGVGALLVVGIHLNNWLYARERAIGPSKIAYFAEWHQFGAIGVDIFFVISGFVIALTMGRYQDRPGTFLIQRVLRIAPLAYIMSALWIFRLYWLDRPFTLDGVISTIVLAPVLPHYTLPTLDVLWTLSFEFTLYLLVCAVLLARRSLKTLLIALCLLPAVGIFHSFGYPLLRWATHPLMFEFTLGLFAYLLWNNPRVPRWLIVAGGIVGGGALLAQFLFGSGIAANPALAIDGTTALRRVVQWALPSFLLLNLALLWQPTDNVLIRLFARIGDASYSIYLIHLFVISMLIGRISLGPDGRWIILFIIAITAGFLLYYCVEKPLTKLLGSIGKKPKVDSSIAASSAP